VLTGDEPAGVLFADFAALSREVTHAFYHEVLQLPVKEIAVQPLAKMTAESDAAKRGGEAMDKLFHGLLTARTLIFIRPDELNPGFDGRETAPAIVPVAPSEKELAAAKELEDALGRQNELHSVLALFDAGIPVDATVHKLPAASLVDGRAEARRAAERLDAASALAEPVLERSRQRMIAALRWLLAQPSTPAELADEVRRLVSTLAEIEPLIPSIGLMRPLAMGVMAIFNNHERASDNDNAFHAAKSRGGQLDVLSDKVRAALRETPFPFEHASGQVKLGAYLVDGVAHPDELVLSLMRAEAIIERIYSVYGRAIGRLAVITMEAEEKMNVAAAVTAVTEPPSLSEVDAHAHSAVRAASESQALK
jgi:hypothetical protein